MNTEAPMCERSRIANERGVQEKDLDAKTKSDATQSCALGDMCDCVFFTLDEK